MRRLPVARKIILNSDSGIELRKKLMRRLIWKVPLIIALVAFAVWWQLNHNTERSAGKESMAANSQLFAMLAGSWAADVTYGSGERHREQFLFQPEGDKLFGTASFRGVKRGIENGKIQGENFSFLVRFDEFSGAEMRERNNYYVGKLSGTEIRLGMRDDRGNPPAEFVLTRSGQVR